MKKINPIHELIARILWWFNHEICSDPEAPIIHLEALLLLQQCDIGPDSLADIRAHLPDIVGGNSISVRSHTAHSAKQICYFVPGTIYARLSELSCNTDLFIFRNKFGGPIDSGQVRRIFALACKKANLRPIKPNQLR